MPCFALKLRSSQTESECSATRCVEKEERCRECLKTELIGKILGILWLLFIHSTHTYTMSFHFLFLKYAPLHLMVMLLLKTVAHVRFGYKMNTICSQNVHSCRCLPMLPICHTQTVNKNAKESNRKKEKEEAAVKCINDMCYFEYSVPKVLSEWGLVLLFRCHTHAAKRVARCQDSNLAPLRATFLSVCLALPQYCMWI